MQPRVFRRDRMEMQDAAQREDSTPLVPPAWIAAAVIGLLVLALLAYGLVTGSSQPPREGEPVPAFALTALDGTAMALPNQQGEVFVLNFFASWCNPCREEAAALEETWRQYEGQEVQFYGIAYKDAASKAQAFLDEFGVTYPSAIDTGNRTARAYGVTGVPETFVIDRSGNVVRHFLGPITEAQLSAQIDQALAP
jgi:cytochrome c biogenesis protein CcmG/thiol:disulfide interchange protein DsbE